MRVDKFHVHSAPEVPKDLLCSVPMWKTRIFAEVTQYANHVGNVRVSGNGQVEELPDQLMIGGGHHL